MAYDKHPTNFTDADEANFQFLKDLFKDSETFKVIRPAKANSVFDGIVVTKKDGVDICILAEVKLRKFTSVTLREEFHSSLFLEQAKYRNLHTAAKKYATQGREVKLWYISVTLDDCVFIHDITNADYQWVYNTMNHQTMVDDQVKTAKKIALLHTSDVIFAKKIK